jgi:cation diffusion facilitator family transporter
MGGIPQLYREARRAAAWGIAVSLGLGLMKLLGGLFGGSLALLTDAVHSLVDAMISGTLLGALAVAERPADPEHPYGHTRVEAVAGLSIALVLVMLALGIGWEALSTLSARRTAPEAYASAIALVGFVLQELLHRHASRVARRTGSGALSATAWDYRLDAIGSLVVLAGVALATWGGPSWLWADNAAAAAAAATILWVAFGLFRDNAEELIDRQADPDLLDAVRREALAVPGVLGVETLRVRKAGLEYLVDIHVEVDPEQTVRQGHDIAHAVKEQIIRHVPPVRDVLVHIEPSPVK